MPPAATKLSRLRWDVPGVGAVLVRAATHPDREAIDEAWPPARHPSDVHHVWRWVDISSELKDCLVVATTDRPVAIWGSKMSRPLKLAGTTYYRVDYLEIDPVHRGKILGAFLIAVIACRALELGAEGIVLAAFPIPGLVESMKELALFADLRGVGAIRKSW